MKARAKFPPSSRGGFAFAIFFSAFALFGAAHSRAQSTSWTNGGSDSWFDPGNWSSGLPGSSTQTYIDNGGIADVTSGSSANAAEVWVGDGGTGGLTLSGGNLTVATDIIMGNAAGSLGTMTVTSGTSSFAQLLIGNSGTGVLNMSGGTLVTTAFDVIGNSHGSHGTVNFSGGNWNTAGIYVGDQGTGILNITAGVLTNSDSFIGANLGGASTATVSGGTWNLTSSLTIGNSGTGTLAVTGGYVTDASGILGQFAGSSGTAIVSSGTWDNTTSLTVGESDRGTVTVSGSGVVSVGSGSGRMVLGNLAGSAGTLNIDGGAVQAAEVAGGAGQGTVNFQATGSSSFTPVLTGTLTVNQSGSGQTVLTGSNTYSGTTTISSGSLAAGSNTAFGSSAVKVSGGTLVVQTSSTISNSVTLSGGGYDRALSGSSSLINAVNATGSFAGGKPDTTASILDGTLSSASTLQTSFLGSSSANNDSIRLSNVYRFQGTGTDVFVLQLSASSVATGSYLAYLDSNGNWVNAVFGNTGGTANFVAGAYNPALDFQLGNYGLDVTNGTVWAVINHNSDYTIVPEPAAWVLIILGLGLGAMKARQATRKLR